MNLKHYGMRNMYKCLKVAFSRSMPIQSPSMTTVNICLYLKIN